MRLSSQGAAQGVGIGLRFKVKNKYEKIHIKNFDPQILPYLPKLSILIYA